MIEPIKLINLETHTGRLGNLTVIQDIPFTIRRAFYIYNVPVNELRGGHAHKKCHQLFTVVYGAVLIRLGDRREYVLDCPDIGLYVPPKHIVYMRFLTDNTTLLVLASEKYDKKDYIYGNAMEEDNG